MLRIDANGGGGFSIRATEDLTQQMVADFGKQMARITNPRQRGIIICQSGRQP